MEKQEILKRKNKHFTLKELKDLLNQTEIVDNAKVDLCIERDGGGESFMLVGVEVFIGMSGAPTVYLTGMEFNPSEEDLTCNEIQNNYDEYAHITADNVGRYWEEEEIFDADGRWSADGIYPLKK